jgi:hypothetical protein
MDTIFTNLGTALTDISGDVVVAVGAGAVVVFGIYALKPAWKTARTLINKLGF